MINTLKKTPSSRKFLSTYSFLGGGRGRGCVLVVGAYLSLGERGREWALINFFRLKDGPLFEVSTNARMGAYSNKHGI